ncbi:hypothetical protein RSAG8_01205, partial [Rhizoctonia solani AG-8 WAC10335]
MSTPGQWQSPNGQGNPDSRPLPPGFVTQFDTSYNTWFYINTQANPPRSQWLHPADHHDQNNPPPGGVNWNALAPGGGTPGGGYSPGPGPAYGQGGYDRGTQQGYPPPQAQHKSSSNTGAIVAAGAVGVVGGALIANAMSDDDDYQDGDGPSPIPSREMLTTDSRPGSCRRGELTAHCQSVPDTPCIVRIRCIQ